MRIDVRREHALDVGLSAEPGERGCQERRREMPELEVEGSELSVGFAIPVRWQEMIVVPQDRADFVEFDLADTIDALS